MPVPGGFPNCGSGLPGPRRDPLPGAPAPSAPGTVQVWSHGFEIHQGQFVEQLPLYPVLGSPEPALPVSAELRDRCQKTVPSSAAVTPATFPAIGKACGVRWVYEWGGKVGKAKRNARGCVCVLLTGGGTLSPFSVLPWPRRPLLPRPSNCIGHEQDYNTRPSKPASVVLLLKARKSDETSAAPSQPPLPWGKCQSRPPWFIQKPVSRNRVWLPLTLCVYSPLHDGSTHTCSALHRWQMVLPPPACAAG